MSLRSPLSRVLGKGSAKEGTEHFWVQRVTAAALALLGLWFIISLLLHGVAEYTVLMQWIARPLNSILLLLLAVTLAWHSSLGVQVVIEDYVHGPFLKVCALVLNSFAHIGVAAAAAFAVLKIAFGAAA